MQNQTSQIISLLGLAQRAGMIASGEDTVGREVKKRKIALLIVADDSSVNTRKRAEGWAEHYHIPIFFFSSRGEIGKAIGKEWRAMLGIRDKGFSKKIQCLLNQALAE